jgi:hypothetical protein
MASTTFAFASEIGIFRLVDDLARLTVANENLLMLRIKGGRGSGCIVCGRRDFHIHDNHEWERAIEAQKAQLRLW